ncbi:hypothetical protein CFOL_v3_33476 [Cephalotus follicularis]|uniref:Uncharacterized protein n=1 Tax=Cephalotus follicularis TaxID=3775 RepID=A0A1Q3DC56_CEPFO|nr:hypothetical protein CFOL_v3_33476 [Cephalotus follicularis]
MIGRMIGWYRTKLVRHILLDTANHITMLVILIGAVFRIQNHTVEAVLGQNPSLVGYQVEILGGFEGETPLRSNDNLVRDITARILEDVIILDGFPNPPATSNG